MGNIFCGSFEMNKKDCESIGHLLSISTCPQEIRERLFEMDDRIESEYIGFEEVQGRDAKREIYGEDYNPAFFKK